MWMLTRWFNFEWWKYLLINCSGFRNFICRIRGHKDGVVWYNVGGSEPDMSCKNCGENLG